MSLSQKIAQKKEKKEAQSSFVLLGGSANVVDKIAVLQTSVFVERER